MLWRWTCFWLWTWFWVLARIPSEGESVRFGLIQIDIAGSSQLEGTSHSIKEAIRIFKEAMINCAIEAKGIRKFKYKWDGDGGQFGLHIVGPKEINTLVNTAIKMRKSIANVNESAPADLDSKIEARISCGIGHVYYSKKLEDCTGDFINSFLKNEREIGNKKYLTINHELKKELPKTLSKLFKHEKRIETSGIDIFRYLGQDNSNNADNPAGGLNWQKQKKLFIALSAILAMTGIPFTPYAYNLLTSDALDKGKGKFDKNKVPQTPEEDDYTQDELTTNDNSEQQISGNPCKTKQDLIASTDNHQSPSSHQTPITSKTSHILYYGLVGCDGAGAFNKRDSGDSFNINLPKFIAEAEYKKFEINLATCVQDCDKPSNSIHFGSEVEDQDVIEAALLFLKSKTNPETAELRIIKRFWEDNRDGANRAKQIQIGYVEPRTNCQKAWTIQNLKRLQAHLDATNHPTSPLSFRLSDGCYDS